MATNIELLQGQPIITFASADKFQQWLDQHHATSIGLWLQIAKKGCREETVSYADALDVALCFGWIDAQKRPVDERYWLQRFTPRRSRSRWSKINCAKVEVLIAAGRVQPAGLRAIEAAKADGRWEAAYAGQATATVPADLQLALDQDPAATAFFATLDKANRYAILYRVNEPTRPETRARRIEKVIAMLRAHETFHPVPQRRTERSLGG